MAGYADEVKRKVREAHWRKKELERKKRKEEKKAQEQAALLQASRQPAYSASRNKESTLATSSSGWNWAKRDYGSSKPAAATTLGTATTREQRDVTTTHDRPAGTAVRRTLYSGGGAVRSSLKTTSRPSRDNSLGSNQSSSNKPVSFVSKTSEAAAASPLSDVTCSQSPSKTLSAATLKPSSVAFAEKMSEEEDDPVAIAHKRAMDKIHKEAEDAVAIARKALLAKEEARKKAAAAGASSPSVAKKPAASYRPLPANVGGGGIVMDEDPVAVSRRLARERAEAKARQAEEEAKAKAKQAEEEAKAKEVRNPIVLEREKERRRSYSSPVTAKGTSAKSPDADLWLDSESEAEDDDKAMEDEDDDSETERKKKKKASKKKAAKKRSSGEGRRSSSSSRRKRSSRGSGRYSDDESGGGLDDEDEDTLIPYFAEPKLGPPSALEPLKLPQGDNASIVHEVPASMNRYLMPYQREGVSFMYSCVVVRGTGSILGDDMGLGKTVQVISLLAALLGKTGTGKDANELKQRRRLVTQKMRQVNALREHALMNNLVNLATAENVEVEGLVLPEYAPVLVIVPPSVIDNWLREFRTWGHFGVSNYQRDRSTALDRVKDGNDEILLCGKALFLNDFKELSSVQWKVIIVDEFHTFKNEKSQGYDKLDELREICGCPIIGMTGTLMQNNHKELWTLIDLVQPGHLGDWKSFERVISMPIKYARTKTADADTVQKSIAPHHSLSDKLNDIFIKRTKKQQLGDELPEKAELVVFCELSDIQKRLYKHVLDLPDYQLLKYANAPCDCGANRSIFMGYKQMRTNKERVAYQRRHRGDIKMRKECCYKIPINPWADEPGDPPIHPQAILWRWQHPDGEECEGKPGCPYCISFPALNKLGKIASHAALLLAEEDPVVVGEDTKTGKGLLKDIEFARVTIPPDLLSELPCEDYIFQDGIMNDHAKLSGKMRRLDKLLQTLSAGDNQVLLFSHYTKTLDIIQQFLQGYGYSYRRLDGSTPQSQRQKIVDEFQSDKTIFIFLISTKAGGLGLNLTAANKVIIFDMDYNPSHEEQAQDRAYRIGQSQDVQVIRLVARGTIEELKYLRQLYKLQLTDDTLGDHENGGGAAKIFTGVQGDKTRKGELFGMENLLKFKDGRFMSELWKGNDEKSDRDKGIGAVRVRDIENGLSNVSAAQVEELGSSFQEAFDKAAAKEDDSQEETTDVAAAKEDGGQEGLTDFLSSGDAMNHEDFLRPGRGEAALKPGDEGFEEEVGGESQAFINILDYGDGMEEDEEDTKLPPVEKKPGCGELAAVLAGQDAINHQDLLRADRGDAALKPGDEGFEEEMGGATQMALDVLDRGEGGDDGDGRSPQMQTSPEEDASRGQPPENGGRSAAATLFENTTESEDESGEEVAAAPRPRVVNMSSRKRPGNAARSVARLATVEESPAREESPPAPVARSVPRKNKKRPAAAQSGPSKTTFSARDISIPSYKKKKRSKK